LAPGAPGGTHAHPLGTHTWPGLLNPNPFKPTHHSAAAGAIICGECACECLRAQSVTHGGMLYAYSEVRRDADGARCTPARNAELSGSIFENCCVARRPEPCGVRPLGGTRHGVVVCEGGARAQALGWYGEQAASRMLHPNRLRRNTHPGLSSASYRPTPGAVTA
jgi:hypothetical protein